MISRTQCWVKIFLFFLNRVLFIWTQNHYTFFKATYTQIYVRLAVKTTPPLNHQSCVSEKGNEIGLRIRNDGRKINKNTRRALYRPTAGQELRLMINSILCTWGSRGWGSQFRAKISHPQRAADGRGSRAGRTAASAGRGRSPQLPPPFSHLLAAGGSNEWTTSKNSCPFPHLLHSQTLGQKAPGVWGSFLGSCQLRPCPCGLGPASDEMSVGWF